jgi:hypothetical protein
MLELLGLLPGVFSFVQTVATSYFNTKVALYQAKTGAEQAVAVAAIQAQAMQNVNSKWWQPQTLIGWSIAIYIMAAVVWDKVVAKFVGCSGHQLPGVCTSFATDPLTGDLHWIMITVITGYFSSVIVDQFMKKV